MAGLQPFNYGNVLAQAENIRGARTENALRQRELDPNSRANQIQQLQLERLQNPAQLGGYKQIPGLPDGYFGQYNSQTGGYSGTVKPVKAEKGPDKQRLYEYAKTPAGGGYAGTFEEFLTLTGPKGTKIQIGGDGFKMPPGYMPNPDFGRVSPESPEGDQRRVVRITGMLSPAELKVDELFAKDYNEFIVAGGMADITKQLGQLSVVTKKLSSSDNITGPFIGMVHDSLLNIFNPEARSAKDAVEEVVQRNLRLVLGAQFTEKEGTRLIARAYNDSMEEGENLRRVTRLMEQIQAAAEAKSAAGQYYEKNGSLKGFKGKIFTKADFLGASHDDPEFLFREEGGDISTSLPVQNVTGVKSPQTDAEFNALPSGTIYIDPDDGKQYRKP